MNRFVLDCSIAMGWCFEDQANALTDKALTLLEDGHALVPHIWFLEIANVLVVAERKNKINKADSVRFFEMLRSLPIVAEPNPLAWEYANHLMELGRAHRLSSYDAAYLDLALRSGLPLATRDVPLLKACKKTGVRVL